MAKDESVVHDAPSAEEEGFVVVDKADLRPVELGKKRRKPTPHALRYPPLTEAMILEWADVHYARTGDWPNVKSGIVIGGHGETWGGLNAALIKGSRGLPGGLSLARLLEEQRGRHNRLNVAPLTEAMILEWADAHHARTGQWPTRNSGRVVGSDSDTWSTIADVLVRGSRTLPGNSSLAQLLAEHRGRPNPASLPPLTEAMILEWADRHYARTGRWPTADSGVVEDGEGTWGGLDQALSKGLRTLPGGSSLAKLLEQHRGRRNRANLPPLTEEQIVAWADRHYARTGQWPTSGSGPISGTEGENWRDISQALTKGFRALPGDSSLLRLLARYRDLRQPLDLPPLTVEQILEWADAHHARTGQWPTRDSGRVVGSDGDTWSAITQALARGTRSLPGGSSLARLLEERRGCPNKGNLPPLTEEMILAWADAHHARTGQWPRPSSGPIPELPGETWKRVNISLNLGIRRLPKGGSLARLLWQRRGVRHHLALPNLTEDAILGWADAFYARHGRWPNLYDGALAEEPEETWARLDTSLRVGGRKLPGGSSLSQLLADRRGLRNPMRLHHLTTEQIRDWAEAYYRRTGAWPVESSEPIPEAPGETWNSIATALRSGRRGLPPGSSLARLLAEVHRPIHRQYMGTLTAEHILRWADAHHTRTGKWPGTKSGTVIDARGITWRTVHKALVGGGYGLPGGDTLAGLLERERESCSQGAISELSEDKILEWAQAHLRRTGRWPSARSGAIEEAPGETWRAIHAALVRGKRGLPGGSSLAQILDRIRSSPATSPHWEAQKSSTS